MTATMTPADVSHHAQAILDEAATVIVGMEDTLAIAVAALLAKGHVLFEDVPGLGKTLAARTLAHTLGLEFSRVQCTPDLLPSDITGGVIFNPATREFDVRQGPLFTGLFLADEINRTAPKTQSALLEAMAERQVTIDGITYPLPQPFHVIATSNPVEFDGTYPLPEAQLDRFMVRLSVGYLSAEDEAHMVTRRLNRHTDTPTVQRIVSSNDFHTMQETIETVLINPDIVDYCVNLVHATRTHAATEVGASPRASQALALLARAYAVVQGRDYVIPEDVKTIAPAVLAHRLTLTATAWATNVDPANIVHSILTSVPTPAITTPTP
ncbi:AAA family ATPase [Jonesia denitrificans]|uniref:ATPase associated with various cellular activities AAA_3 n=1 Tax=Jonesia denitrificans (strain ATCC 14870 / DSM 20603 / BCRC 15368 / CIP 55.134 / JCM 11481 / NBRC 15587 / NCTC 10816 / Prevot 55134) TaxID=471856 RepID=C7R482_JONDD|nr:MoxR family ATPase [Jonesia denitrificans]ACV08939.1 ATPase associated with various cellular activities AAA_3 [Jonesia denitrificans DSM 20603]ASE09753.1 MoxR family ATPase [Jonesia denitrificans]QXB44289.1 MoxR family ATPase [Jonesia denitrificans]SQH21006.1 magnesium chelatase subunit D [Jonesia denitrificans]